MGSVKRYCPDCGSRIEFQSILSTVRVPNEFRKFVYRCKHCSEEKKRDVLIAIIRKNVPEKTLYEDIDVIIIQSTT